MKSSPSAPPSFGVGATGEERSPAGGRLPSDWTEIDAAEALRDLRDANEKLVLATIRSQELAEAAAQAEALFNALPDIIARFDGDFRNVYLNASAEAVTGRPRSDFFGKTPREIGLPSDLLSDWTAILADAFTNGRAAEKLFSFDLHEGQRVFHVRTIPERDASGAIASVVAIARDVTDSEMHRRARADADRLRRLQALTAAFSEAPTVRDIARALVTHAQEALSAEAAIVMLFDESGRRLELAAFVGYPPLIMERWASLPIDTPAPLSEVIRTGEPLFFGTHRAVLDRYPWLAEDRHEGDEALAAIPLTFAGRCFGAVAIVFRRPREFAQSEREFIVSLARHSVHAMDRARLLEAERLARREAEAANRLKDEFLATMSHELRTPLNAVMGWAALLRTKTDDPGMMQRAIDAIDRNARAQATLVEDVLDVSRIISGKLRLEIGPVDVTTVVSAALDVVRAAADAKQIDLRLDIQDACVISGDASRLQQVVWNLLSNAVKFSGSGARVAVTVKRLGNSVAIEVSDTGEGISREFLPHVFERCRQFDGSTTRRQGGLGLGLAIVRHLVELHGGTVVARSEGLGKGAVFTVLLPMNSIQEPLSRVDAHASRSPANETTPADDLQGLRLLVVDDDEDARTTLRIVLEECGAEVFTAVSAENGLGRPPRFAPTF